MMGVGEGPECVGFVVTGVKVGPAHVGLLSCRCMLWSSFVDIGVTVMPPSIEVRSEGVAVISVVAI